MAEQVNIASFNFDTEAMQKSILEAEKKLFDLTKAQREATKEGRELQKESETLAKAMALVAESAGEESDEYRELKKELDNNTKSQRANFSETQKLTREKAAQTKEYRGLISAHQQATQKLNENTSSEEENIRTIQIARDENRELTKQRNNLNTETEEGAKAIAAINSRIDENNAYIKQNQSELEKQRMNVGNYTKSIIDAYEALEEQKKALEENKAALIAQVKEAEKGSDTYNILKQQINILNVQINEVSKSMDEATGQTKGFTDNINLLNSSGGSLTGTLTNLVDETAKTGNATGAVTGMFKSATSGLLGLVKASLTFIATPIGLVITALAVGVGLVVNAFKRSEDSANKLTGVMSKLSGMFSTVMKVLEPLGDFLIDVIVEGFDLAITAFEKWLGVVSSVASFVGLDSLATWVDDVKVGFNEASVAASNLVNAEQNIIKSNRELRQSTADSIVEMEALKTVMEDTTRTIAERENASNKLSSIIKEQGNLQRNVAQQELDLVRQRIQTSGKTTELIDAEIEAVTKLNTIRAEEITREREALTKRNDFRKQAHEAYLKQVDERINKEREMLDFFIQSQGIEKKSIEETLSLEQDRAIRSEAILKSELDAKKISIEKYNTEVLKLQQGLAKSQAEASVEIANHELEMFKLNFEQKQLEENRLTQESFQARQEFENQIYEQQLEIERSRLENGLITQREFDALSNQITLENLETNKQIKAEFDAQQKEEDAYNRLLENEAELLYLQEKNASDFEIRKAMLAQNNEEEKLLIQQQREQGLITEQQYLQASSNLEKQYSLQSVELKREEEKAKLGLVGSAFGQLSSLMGENSKLGKALSLSQALINTYQGITAGVALGFPEMIPAVSMASTTGFAAVKNITKTKTPKAERGASFMVGGSRHSSGGTNYYGEDGNVFNAERGEMIGVMNRGATSSFMDFNKTFYKNSTGNYDNDSFIKDQINTEELASALFTAVKEGSQQGTYKGANDGIIERNENSYIQQNATF